MLSRTSMQFVPACTNVRGMATLKDISMRLKAVTNIRKITKSMKMISAAKYARAERELRPARSYGVGAKAFYDVLDLPSGETKPTHLVIAISSDKGLCGAVHTSIYRSIRKLINEKPECDIKIIAVGEKIKALLYREFKNNLLLSFTGIGKNPPSFSDANLVADEIMKSGVEFESSELLYNKFRTVVAYNTTSQPIHSLQVVANSDGISSYDSIDEDVLRNFSEFSLSSMIYFALKEGACSEQSARMSAMEGATKNAGEMIEKLQLTYNRTRQAVITRELIEIISGAAAL